MKNLFELLESIIATGYALEILTDADQVVSFAENCNMSITHEMAESVISVHANWQAETTHGNGEWDRMRREAEAGLECYVDSVSGNLATAEMLRQDYDSMDSELWFGKPAEECESLDWLHDAGQIQVEWDGSDWVEA